MNRPDKPAARIEDIARQAGVHPGSVSRALRGIPGKVSAETRARILRIAADLGYQPNLLAASLRTRRTDQVGVVVPDIGNPLFAPILQALETELSQQGLVCLVMQPPQAAAERIAAIGSLASRQLSGLLVLAAEVDDPMLDEIRRLRLPAVLVNRGSSDRGFSSVVNDDQESVRLVLDHLTGLGHRRIAHLAGPKASTTGIARRDAFVELAPRYGLVDPVVIESSAFTREAGAIATRQLLARGSAPPTAVFAANDLIALGAVAVLRERSLAVPEDLSLVGHNDMPLMDLIEPPLTTVHVAVDQMGRHAARMLLDVIADPHEATSTRVLMPRLVVRGSTGPARA